MKLPIRFVLVIGGLLVLSLMLTPLSAQQEGGPSPVGLRPDAPTYAMHGPYWVGTKEFVIPDEDGNRPLPATIWYPALNPERVTEANTYQADYIGGFLPHIAHQGHALVDAAPDASVGPYPLVVFSHGSSWTRLGYVRITEHLASYGFVVIAVDHVGNTIAEGVTNQIQAIFYRPHDVTRAIDFAETLTGTDSALAGLIDTQTVAVAGHSDGGLTALLSGGARMNMVEAAALCAGNGPHTFECDEWLNDTGRTAIAREAGFTSEPVGGLYPSYGGDPRVKAIIPVAASGEIEETSDLTTLTMPTMLMLGSIDRYNPLSGEEHIYRNLPAAQKALVVFDNADHFIFFLPCEDASWGTVSDLYFLCADAVWDMDRAHDLINHFTTAFLLDTLKGDEDAHAALLAENVSFPGIEYMTTME